MGGKSSKKKKKKNSISLQKNSIPRRIARMGERDVTNAEVVVSAQNAEAVAQRVATLDAQ